MSNLFTVLSPISGALVALEQVPDPVFSKRMLGSGVAIDAAEDIICAPFDGKITNFNKNLHAFVIASDSLEVLIHVGLDSIHLKGTGFTAFVKPGESVLAGQPILRFDRQLLNTQLTCPLVLCVITSPRNAQLAPLTHETVQSGQPLFTVNTAPAQKAACPLQPALQSQPITILNRHGLHARPAGQLARLAGTYAHNVFICKGTRRANAKSITGIMGLALVQGDQIILSIEGPADQAQAFLQQLENGFANGFGEAD